MPTPIMSNDYLTTVAHFPNTFSPEECRLLVNLPLPVSDAGVDERNNAAGKVDYSLRRTREKPIPPELPYAWIFQRLGKLCRDVNQHIYRFQLGDLVTVQVLEYSPEGFFGWHTDLGSGIYSTRKLSMVTFLAPPEEYEGGDLCFMDGGPPYRLPLGTTAIFPSYLLHKVDPVTRGTRFTMVSWVHGPSFS